MPDKITKLDFKKLLSVLEERSPGVQLHFHGDVTFNVNLTQTTDASTTVNTVTDNSVSIDIDYSFIEKLDLTGESKKEVKSTFEKFAGTLKSYKEGSEGLKVFIDDCAKYGPTAVPAIQYALQLLQQTLG